MILTPKQVVNAQVDKLALEIDETLCRCYNGEKPTNVRIDSLTPEIVRETVFERYEECGWVVRYLSENRHNGLPVSVYEFISAEKGAVDG